MLRLARCPALFLCLLTLACGREETTSLEGRDGAAVADSGTNGGLDGTNGPGDVALSDPDGATPTPDAAETDDLGQTIVPDGGESDDAEPLLVDAIVMGDTDAMTTTPDGGPARPDGAVPTPDAGACTTDRDCGRGGGFTVFCEPATGQCVECFQNQQCRQGQVCDTVNGNLCRLACFAGGRCPRGQTCDPVVNACFECVDDTGCNNGEHCAPVTRECVECFEDSHCANQVGRTICDLSSNECVACASDADCPGGICDPGLDACVTGTTGRGLCEVCDADDQCGGPDDHCIGTISGGGFQDRSCAIDCSNLTCPAGFDCVPVRNNTAQQCRPSYAMPNPSCTAIRNLGSSCAFSASNTDPGCGIESRNDALCILAPGGMGGVCTIGCDAQTPCPVGFTCTGAMPGSTGVCL